MKNYISEIVETNKYTIIGCLVNTGTAYLLLHILQCWLACAVDKYNWDIPMVLYYSGTMYKNHPCLEFIPIKKPKKEIIFIINYSTI